MSQQSPHIAVFSLAWHPFEGGAEIAAREIIRRNTSWRADIFTHHFDALWQKRESQVNATIIRLGSGRGSYYKQRFQKMLYVFRAYRAALKAHKKEPFQMVWGVMAAYSGMAALLFKMRHPRIPFLLTLQEGDAESHILKRVGILYPLWKQVFKKADHIQVISSYLKSFAIRHGATCPITVIPNGVDLEKFEIPHAKKKSEKKIIVTTSRLVLKNGIDTLIRACEKLEGVDYELRIAGEGPLKGDLQNLSSRIGLESKVKFLGHISQEEIPKFLSEADLFVRPSRSEGLGSSFLEAMAAGVPIIGTNVGGIIDFLEDYKTGLFVKSDDADNLAVKIKESLTNQTLHKKLSLQGKKLVEEKYSWELISSGIDKIVKSISKKRVLIATGIFPPDIGGSATWSARMLQYLPERDMVVRILTYGNHQSLEGVSSVPLSFPKGIRHLVYLMRLIRLASEVDVVIAADSSFGAATLAVFVAQRLRIPSVVRVTGDYAWEQGQARYRVIDTMEEFQTKRYGFMIGLLKRAESYAVRKATSVIAPSNYLKEIVIGWGVLASHITVIYNAASEPLSLSHNEAREKLSMTAREKVVVSIGRLVPWKGFQKIIKAAESVSKAVPHFKLVIIGDGPEEEKLKILAGDNPHVLFTGRLSQDHVALFLRAADVFVLNTSYEGFSHQIVEALSYGLPVVTTDAGGNKELIELMQSSGQIIQIPYNDLWAIEHALISSLKGVRAEYRESESRMFSIDRMCDMTADILKKVSL